MLLFMSQCICNVVVLILSFLLLGFLVASKSLSAVQRIALAIWNTMLAPLHNHFFLYIITPLFFFVVLTNSWKSIALSVCVIVWNFDPLCLLLLATRKVQKWGHWGVFYKESTSWRKSAKIYMSVLASSPSVNVYELLKQNNRSLL